MQFAFCRAHVRRKLFDFHHTTGSRIAERNQIEVRSVIEDHPWSRGYKGQRRCACDAGAFRLTWHRLWVYREAVASDGAAAAQRAAVAG